MLPHTTNTLPYRRKLVTGACRAAHALVNQCVSVCALAGARLQRVIPAAQRVVLPDSGHAALLEREVDLAALMQGAWPARPSTNGNGNGRASGANKETSTNGSGDGSAGGSSAKARQASSSKAAAAGPQGKAGRAQGQGGGVRSGGLGAAFSGEDKGYKEDSFDEWTSILAPWRVRLTSEAWTLCVHTSVCSWCVLFTWLAFSGEAKGV